MDVGGAVGGGGRDVEELAAEPAGLIMRELLAPEAVLEHFDETVDHPVG